MRTHSLSTTRYGVLVHPVVRSRQSCKFTLQCEHAKVIRGDVILSFFGDIQPERNMFAMHRRKNMNSQAYQDYLLNSTIRILTDILLSILSTALASVLPVLKHLPNLKYFVLSYVVPINFHNKIVSGETKQSAHNFKI